jgi:(R,R)-butanediol dehydrogenase/meso-butanediol dehydrogenase/diacetyl reductase
MKAAVYEGLHEIDVKDIPAPEVGPRDVLIRPKYVGICGSDLSAWEYGMYEGGVVVGHEFSGEVVATGDEVEHLSRGDKVVPNSLIPCLSCKYCKSERYSLCEDMQMVGISMNGGMAELVSLPDSIVYKLPPDADLKNEALVEPLSVAIHGFKRVSCMPDMSLLILGAGSIGLLSLLYAKSIGSNEVFVSEVKQARLELASQLGCTHAINPATTPLALSLESLTQNRGVDLVIECSGAAEPTAESFSLVKRGGKILILGISEEPIEADFMTGVLNELTVDFSYLGYAEFPEAIDLVTTNKIDVSPLITKVIRLDDVVDRGFESLTRPDSEDVKVLVEI